MSIYISNNNRICKKKNKRREGVDKRERKEEGQEKKKKKQTKTLHGKKGYDSSVGVVEMQHEKKPVRKKREQKKIKVLLRIQK